MAEIAHWLDHAHAHALRLQRAFDARARRERLLLIVAGVAVAWMLGDSLWLTPAFKGWSAARTHRSSTAESLQRLNDEIGQRGTATRSSEQQLRSELMQTRERIASGDSALSAFGATLVSATEMVPMLDRLLTDVGGLRLRSMHSLGRTELGGNAAASPKPAAPGASASAAAASSTAPSAGGALYRHGVELTVEGSYADVLAYLRAIEAMPQRVLWGGLQLKVEEHPSVVVTLRLYTLSPDRNWLEI